VSADYLMMNQTTILQLLLTYAQLSGKDLDRFELTEKNPEYNKPLPQRVDELINILNVLTDSCHFAFNLHHMPLKSFMEQMTSSSLPIIIFAKGAGLNPIALTFHAKTKKCEKHIINGSKDYVVWDEKNLVTLAADKAYLFDQGQIDNTPEWAEVAADEIIFITGYPVPSLLTAAHRKGAYIHPIRRIFRLLQTEKKDISYIYFYAIMMGMVSLSLPLGIQAIIGLISGGLFINSVIVLMVLVILATIVSGWLQVLQLSVVEILQQRLFAKASVEFTFRIPRIKIEALHNQYAPELMNRFFDIMAIQKSLPKILIDLSTAGVQIIFGLLLLSLYHPLFIFFGILIVALIVVIFYSTGPKAIETNLNASKYKYKVAYWLEELARSMNTFKLAGSTPLPMYKTDKLLDQYLKYRQAHFKILVKQFKAIIAFKTFITGGLLILGGILVVEKQINLGQFVAAEVIILLVLASVEKLISILESIYDLITAADKVGHVTDIELEHNQGMSIEQTSNNQTDFNLTLRNITYTYPDTLKPAIENVSLEFKTGEKICICGYNGSGKSTLVKILSGLYFDFSGSLMINGMPLHEVNLHSYRSAIADNLSDQDIFEGSIEQNISLGRNDISIADILDSIKKVHLDSFIFSLPNGIKTHLQAGGYVLSKSNKEKLLLARSIAGKPKLLLIDEFFYNAEKNEKENILQHLFNPSNKWGIVIISNDREIMKKCDRLVMMDQGNILITGTFEELNNTDIFNRI
jgi:ABC-type bacteriocin/lantibiotic exporter with double-glycine peptidase domain